jgi:hypothetical protein
VSNTLLPTRDALRKQLLQMLKDRGASSPKK